VEPKKGIRARRTKSLEVTRLEISETIRVVLTLVLIFAIPLAMVAVPIYLVIWKDASPALLCVSGLGIILALLILILIRIAIYTTKILIEIVTKAYLKNPLL
jgi:hypothetical protein